MTPQFLKQAEEEKKQAKYVRSALDELLMYEDDGPIIIPGVSVPELEPIIDSSPSDIDTEEEISDEEEEIHPDHYVPKGLHQASFSPAPDSLDTEPTGSPQRNQSAPPVMAHPEKEVALHPHEDIVAPPAPWTPKLGTISTDDDNHQPYVTPAPTEQQQKKRNDGRTLGMSSPPGVSKKSYGDIHSPSKNDEIRRGPTYDEKHSDARPKLTIKGWGAIKSHLPNLPRNPREDPPGHPDELGRPRNHAYLLPNIKCTLTPQ